jgi:hypothetical protein
MSHKLYTIEINKLPTFFTAQTVQSLEQAAIFFKPYLKEEQITNVVAELERQDKITD